MEIIYKLKLKKLSNVINVRS